MLYFAYGSNMHAGQMKERCPSAKFVCRANCPHIGWPLPAMSVSRGCGVADILRDETNDVWGVVYELGRVNWKTSTKTKRFDLDGLTTKTSTPGKIVTYGARAMRNSRL